MNQDTFSLIEGLEDKLKERVIGQDEAIKQIAAAVKNGEFEVTNDRRPKASFLFLGPTGVGKTEVTLALAEALYGSDDKAIRFDMSEYMEKSSISSLIGDSSKKYPGRLAEELNKLNGEPAILLFDEMEKAHKDIMMIFMQILSAARITTGDGKTHNLSNCYIILTSNIGSEKISEGQFKTHATLMRSIKSEIISCEYPPEFVGRFNHNIICFNKLDFKAQKKLAKLIIDHEIQRLKKIKGVDLTYTDDFLYYAIRYGQDAKLGARPMLNFVETNIQGAVVDQFMARRTTEGITGVLDACTIEKKAWIKAFENDIMSRKTIMNLPPKNG